MAAQEVPFGANEQFGIAEVLQMVSLRGRSGRLLLIGETAQAALEFARGQVTGGDLLPPVPTLDLAEFSPEQRRQAIHADVQRTLIEVLGWNSGRAAFYPDDSRPAPELTFDVDMLLLDAVRMLDEWQETGGGLPSSGECLVWADTPPAGGALPTELERRIIALCQGRVSLGEIARRLHVPDVEVLKAARALLDRRFVHRLEDAPALSEAMQEEAAVEAELTRRVVALQVRTAGVLGQRSRERQMQRLIAAMLEAVDALAGVLAQPSAMAGTSSAAWLAGCLAALQGQYAALELLSIDEAGVDGGDLAAAYAALSGPARDDFYAEALDGLYDLLLRLAVRLVEEHVGARPAAERLRGTLGALLLEVETAIRALKPPATLPARQGDLSAVRQKHFHLVA